MRALPWRRALTWTALTLFLLLLAQALALVWTANGRQWYIDSGGLSATLDMSVTDEGRWLATAALGGLIVLCLLALAAELASVRGVQTAQRPSSDMTQELRTVTYTPVNSGVPARDRSAPAAQPAPQPQRGHYEATVVGDDVTRRMEHSLSPELPTTSPVAQPDRTATASDMAAADADGIGPASAVEETVREPRMRAAIEEAPTRAYSTVPLRMAGRR